VDRRPPTRAAALRGGADRQDPVLQPPPPRATRAHRLGPGEVPLRGQRVGRPREAAVRVLLPAPPGPGPRRADHGPHAPGRDRRGGAMTPTVTVAIPVLDEAPHIDACLRAVAAQTYGDVIEVLVVDGGSSDDTCALAARHPGVRVLHNPRRIQAAALNIALAAAQGEAFVRVDGHCLIAPDYVERC